MMLSGAELRDVDFLAVLPDWALDRLARDASIAEFPAGAFITRQHEKADTAYFLTHGNAQVFLRFEGAGDLLIETLSESTPALGWSVFRPPYRYTASTRAETPCTAVAVPRQAFAEVFAEEPALEFHVLQQVARVVAERLERTVDLLLGRDEAADAAAEARTEPIGQSSAAPAQAGPHGTTLPTDALAILQDAPFFEHFSGVELDLLVERARVEQFRAGEHIIHRGAAANSFHMLLSGTARLVYSDALPAMPQEAFSSQTIREPGRVIGWSALVEPFSYRAGAVAVADCRTLAFDHIELLEIAEEHPEFGRRLMVQVLWLLGSRLRETRMRMVARRYDDEVIAIRALIDQHAEELSVSSPLHKLPHFLQNRVTVPDAITAMELLAVDGDAVERSLAVSCLDLMVKIRRELALYQQLQAVYQDVAGTAPGTDPAEVRRRCSRAFVELFEQTDYVIEGLERLPERPGGHLVIMNHLSNDESNAMPSGFHLTMDSHFVSAMILFRTYGRAPIRVIRKSSPDEYAHQMYYDQLGYIYVFRSAVDPAEIGGGQSTEERREAFLRQARGHLARGENIVICPEGECTTTDHSPLPFRSGTFLLAARTNPEPLIIPISLANFDKQLTRTTLAATIHEPFRMSDVLPPDAPVEALYAWVKDYQRTFAGYVAQTRQLANEAAARRG